MEQDGCFFIRCIYNTNDSSCFVNYGRKVNANTLFEVCFFFLHICLYHSCSCPAVHGGSCESSEWDILCIV